MFCFRHFFFQICDSCSGSLKKICLWIDAWGQPAPWYRIFIFPKSRSTILRGHDWCIYSPKKTSNDYIWWMSYYDKALKSDIAILSTVFFTTACFKLIPAGWLRQTSFWSLRTIRLFFFFFSFPPSEAAISRQELLIVYKNTWLKEAAPLESIIRHRNLDTLGMCEPFEVNPLWGGGGYK